MEKEEKPRKHCYNSVSGLPQVGDTGLEQPPEFSGKTGLSETGGAKSDVNSADLSLLAADLRNRLSTKECRRLAKLLTCTQESGKP